MIINETVNYMALCTCEGLTAWIKTAENTYCNKRVITKLVITEEGNTSNIIYKDIHQTWISYYNNEDGFSLLDIIEDLLYFIKYYESNYMKNTIISGAINNEGIHHINIKRFKKENIKHIEDMNRQEAYNKKLKEDKIIIANILKQINDIITLINNKYELITFSGMDTKKDKYTHEIATIHTLKVFTHDYENRTKIYTDTLKHLEEYLNYLQCDIDPIEFMTFDKVMLKEEQIKC